MNVASFVAEYTEKDERHIAFSWNGKHADDFADANMEFRNAVAEYCVGHSDLVSPLLWRHLYRASTEFSREAWCIDGYTAEVGHLMLIVGGPQHIGEFLEGKHSSFDTYCGVTLAGLDPELLHKCDRELDRLLAAGCSSKERDIYIGGKELISECLGEA